MKILKNYYALHLPRPAPGNGKKKISIIKNKILATAKNATTYKGVSIKYSNPV
jgi:hypothetical protein